jgi:adenosylhomocysteine nucleosidase
MPANGSGTVAVVTAIREELEAVLSRARDVRFDRTPYARARIGAVDVVIAATGDGPENAARGAAALCDAFHPAALVGVGVAGGLTRSLAALDLLAAARIRQGSDDAPPPDAALVARAVATGARRGTLITVSAPVVSAGARRDLAATLGGEPSGVDMESAEWARAAASRGVPYLVVRAISDVAEESLPDFLVDSLGADGGIRRSAVARRALLRPASWGVLLRMRRRVHDGGVALGAFLDRFFAETL